MDGARPDEARHAPRGRLAILLAIALALPVLIVVLGSHTAAPALLEVADAAPTQVVTQASTEPTTTESPTTTTDASTTSAEASTTAWSYASTSPTTAWSSSTAAKSTSAPTTSKAPTTTAPPVAKAAPTTAPVVAPPTTAKPTPTTKAASQSAAAFLACVRQRESGGNYSINTGNGFYGAYQFMQSTWNNAALLAGRPDLVGLRPDLASPADQDAVALALYNAVGPSPWGGVCY